jgi:predicted O-methyltransferase YrrM
MLDGVAEVQTEFANLEDYSSGHSSPPPFVYPEMEFNTRHFLPSGSHMVSGASQGRWLTQLASISREGRVLELGTFTGYATACMLEGAANAGESTGVSDGSRDGGPFVMTMERDGRAIDIAVAHLNILCQYGVGEEAAEAACALRGSGSERKCSKLVI